MASQCYTSGRIEAAMHYSEVGHTVLSGGGGEVPYGFEGLLAGVYAIIGQPERMVERFRAQLARGRDTHALTRVGLVLALAVAGSGDEAIAAATGLIDAAKETCNPYVLSFALYSYGLALREVDPQRALDAMYRGLVMAHDSGNRANETHLAGVLCQLEFNYGDPHPALDHVTLAIRNYHDSGDTTTIRSPLAVLAAFLDRLGHHEQAATIAGFALSPMTAAAYPEINTTITHLRDVLGDQTYESLARKGETMSTAAMVAYAYDQIDQARTELNAVSK
jgi:tetratricopeptide (TPR) repeat protein